MMYAARTQLLEAVIQSALAQGTWLLLIGTTFPAKHIKEGARTYGAG